ncbi:hypothetical protein CDAR_572721 [Caerostris darwini]|uniref:Uncharacterized protein n=1 Tax=Caerostris darwini TaxID=1538125 RepID=A0AAV4VSK3_9ARAC|nr:hypothetical protein CDAR_572721 [Caerostris darwini]
MMDMDDDRSSGNGSLRSPLKVPASADVPAASAPPGPVTLSESDVCLMLMIHGKKIGDLQIQLKTAVDTEKWMSHGVDLGYTKLDDIRHAHQVVLNLEEEIKRLQQTHCVKTASLADGLTFGSIEMSSSSFGSLMSSFLALLELRIQVPKNHISANRLFLLHCTQKLQEFSL